jgi:hypothetical protein
VYFTTTTPLTAGGTAAGSNLYMAGIGCPDGPAEACAVSERSVTLLTQVSHDPDGVPAEVQGVVRTSPDGSRTYFVARGVLTNEPGPEGRVPLEGADNLYVYTVGSGTSENSSTSGSIKFIADLCSGEELSGVVVDSACPESLISETQGPARNDSPLWSKPEFREAQTTANGDFLVFSSYARLTDKGVEADVDSGRDVYRFDDRTGVLERVSIGEASYDANGNNSAFSATIAPAHSGGPVSFQYEMDNRAISENGERIVFTTSGSLSPNAINGLENVYEWQEGQDGGEGSVSLISSGDSSAPVEDVVISPGGRDIFFITVQKLLPEDTDEAFDVYDARIDGGFPEPFTGREECSSDACQGPLTNPAPLLVPGSVAQAPGENLVPPAVKSTVKPKVAKSKKKPKRRKGISKAKKRGVSKRPLKRKGR